MNKIVLDEKDTTINDIILKSVRITTTTKFYKRGKKYLLKPINLTPYSDTFSQLIKNVVNQDYKRYKRFIDAYLEVIPSFNIKLTTEQANQLFVDYIVPASYRAAKSQHMKAVATYSRLIKQLAKIANQSNESTMVVAEPEQQLTLKKEVA